MRMFKLINLYKQNKIDREELERRMRSYFGWMKFCNSKNLLKKIETLTGLKFSNWNGMERKSIYLSFIISIFTL
jgi:hypothetical protein|nr:MAG TPA: RCD1-SRO-TAF4 (RST) plant domain [Bacteriophage sp.]